MIPRRVITMLFLSFAIIIAFYNILLGRPIYLIGIIPFLIAHIFNNKKGRIVEAFGIVIIALYLMAFQALYIGMLGMMVGVVLLFTLGIKRKSAHLFVYASSLAVLVCSYINPYEYPNIILAAILSSAIYFICAMSIHIALDNFLCDSKREMPLDEKCLQTLEIARDTAREAIELAKEERKLDGQLRAHCRT